jgi:hypothetical protein
VEDWQANEDSLPMGKPGSMSAEDFFAVGGS